MKKNFVCLLCFLVLSTTQLAFARSEIVFYDKISEEQERISQIGFKLLNANNIDKRMSFIYDISKEVNAATSTYSRRIYVYRGLIQMVRSDDELAGVLAHEISHGVDSYKGPLRGAFSSWAYFFSPKKYEYKADKMAVDYMVQAGYNPIAFIVIMNKIFPQRRYDWCSTHALSSRRMMEVYEYIYKKYPEYLVDNPYKNNIYYQNFLLTSKENRKKLQNKIEAKSNKPLRYM